MAELTELVEEPTKVEPQNSAPSLVDAWVAAQNGEKLESPKPIPLENKSVEKKAVDTTTTTQPEPIKTTPESVTNDTTAKPAEQSTPINNPAPSATDELPDEVFYGRLSKMTEGRFKTETDFVGFINDYNELVEQAEKGFQPQFKDERARLAYQIIAENPGKEPEAAMRTLRALSFNPEGKSAEETLFEAFLIDPRNADLSSAEAQKHFEAEYADAYYDVDNNILAQRKQSLAVREAQQNLAKIKDSFKPAIQQEDKPNVDLAEWNNRINGVVDNFGGVKMAFTDKPTENDYLSMAIEESEVATLKEHTADSSKWWNNFLEKFVDERTGKFDDPAFVQEFYEMTHHQKKAQLAFQHGKKLGELAKINESRNASDAKRVDQTTPSAPVGPSFIEAWNNAQKG